MRSTTTFRRGQVVVVRVPFTDGSGSKNRPALVVSAQSFHRGLPDLIVCPISSQARYFEKPRPGDWPLARWRTAGLKYPSTARVSNIVAVDKALVGRIVGRIAREDLEGVDQALRDALGLTHQRTS